MVGKNSKNGIKWHTLQLHSANIDGKSQIVLNDLRLLELLHTYPFLFIKSMLPQNDKDYEEWGWKAITKEFNSSYKGFILRKPFTVEKLRSRWAVLQPMCRSFKSTHCRLPSRLLRIIEKIRQLMFIHPSPRVTAFTPTSLFILNQLPLVEQLSPVQQRQLEAEVLDAIFSEERISRSASGTVNEIGKQVVHRDCEEFLKSIRMKDVLENVRKSPAAVRSPAPATINGEPKNILQPIKPLILKVEPPDQLLQNELPQQQEPQDAPQQQQFTEDEIKEQPLQQCEDHEKPLPQVEQQEPQSPKHQLLEEPLSQGEQKQKPFPEEQQGLQELMAAQSVAPASQPIDSQVQYVPLKMVKYHVKKVKVQIRRLKLEEFETLPIKRQRLRRRY